MGSVEIDDLARALSRPMAVAVRNLASSGSYCGAGGHTTRLALARRGLVSLEEPYDRLTDVGRQVAARLAVIAGLGPGPRRRRARSPSGFHLSFAREKLEADRDHAAEVAERSREEERRRVDEAVAAAERRALELGLEVRR